MVVRADPVPAPRRPAAAGLAAKFSQPVAAGVVSRPALFELLAAGAGDGAVTLLSAAGGWGKTLLVASWLQAHRSPRPVAWVTLDAADRDEDVFWSDVVTALTHATATDPAAAARLRQLAGSPTHGGPMLAVGIAAALAASPNGVLLVLDNLQEVTSPAVHEELLRLVDHPGIRLRLVVCTRHDPPWPLHRLRLEGRLSELRAADLAMGADHAAAMLASTGVELTEPQLAELVARTEGWAGGLRLAGLSLARTSDPDGFLATFSGDERSISDYLLSELLEPAGPLREFLVPISVVDVVCGDLADALTGRRDSASRLAELAAANVFMQGLARPGRWYRLHRLAADVLRGQLTDPAARRDLHRRAATWYQAQEQPWQALEHAVEGALWPMAAELSGRHVADWVLHGGARRLDVLLSRVPHDVTLAHPELATGLAGARVIHGRGDDLDELADAGRDRLGSLPPPRRARTRVVLDVIDMGRARLAGDMARLLEAIRRLPDRVDGWAGLDLPGWDALAVGVLNNRGTAEFWLGQDADAAAHLQAAVRDAGAAGATPVRGSAQSYLALLDYQHGDLPAAARRALDTVSELAEIGFAVSPQAAASYLALGGVGVDQDDLADADRWLAAAAQVVARIPEPPVVLTLAALSAQRRASDGDPASGLADLRETLARFAGHEIPPALRDRLTLVEAELCRQDGNIVQAAEHLDHLSQPASAEATAARTRLSLDLDQADSAGPAGNGDLDVDDTSPRRRVERELLAGLLASRAGDASAAFSHLESALVVAGPLQLRRPFLDQAARTAPMLSLQLERGTDAAEFAADLLYRCAAQHTAPTHSPLVAPLTSRELEVLHHLPSSLEIAEIAATLFVSTSTIKTHLASIYRKLGATGRRDAVRRARTVGLL